MNTNAEFNKILKEKEFVVIPTKNVRDIYQDEWGLIRVAVGADDDNGNMIYFVNGDSIVNGNLYDLEEEE